MEIIKDTNAEKSLPGLTPEAMDELGKARKWTLFLSILGIIMIALMLLTPILFLSFLPSSTMHPFGASTFSLIPLLFFGAIYFFPIYYLFRFSLLSGQALSSGDETLLALAFKFLRKHYHFLGVLVIITVGIYILAILGAFIGFRLGHSFFGII